MAQDGSYAISVGTDKKILLFDIRCMKAVASMDATHFPEMHDLALFSQPSNMDGGAGNMSSMGGMPTSPQNSLVDSLNGFAAIGHNDGSVSIWNLNMRQCFAHQKLHTQQVRGVSYSVDGYQLASAGYDGLLHISDTVNLD